MIKSIEMHNLLNTCSSMLKLLFCVKIQVFGWKMSFSQSLKVKFMKNQNFYAPGLKGPPEVSSNWIVQLSVRLSVCLSVIPSRLQNKVQYLKFGWW